MMSIERRDSSLSRALREAAGRQWWHMPAHAGRLALWAALDATELPGTDDLRAPSGPIAAMSEAMACRAGAGTSLPLCGGGTLGITAMILGCLDPGDTLIVPRSAHLSIWNACALGDIGVVAVPSGSLEESVAAGSGAQAVLADSPDYFGRVRDLKSLVTAARRRGMAVLVDEAHGAHFPYLNGWEMSAARVGADAWVHSAHKTLPVLTGGAWLHLRDAGRAAAVRDAQNLVMTTSPSFLILASLEAARVRLESDGGALIGEALARVGRIRRALAVWGLLYDPPGAADPMRPVLAAAATGLTGQGVLARLADVGVDAEMADADRVVLIPSLLHSPEDEERLLESLAGLPRGAPPASPVGCILPAAVISDRLDVRRVVFSPKEWVEPLDAVDRICGGAVGVYPPGWAYWAPGERITRASAEALCACVAAGACLFGDRKGRVPVMHVP